MHSLEPKLMSFWRTASGIPGAVLRHTQSLVSWERFMALWLQRVLGEGFHQPFSVEEEGAGLEWDPHPCLGWQREIGKFQWYTARKQPWVWWGQGNNEILTHQWRTVCCWVGMHGLLLQRASALGKSPGEGDRWKECAALAELTLVFVLHGSWLLWVVVSSSQGARVEISDLIFVEVQKHALYDTNSLHRDLFYDQACRLSW